jgi:hypothetical protein
MKNHSTYLHITKIDYIEISTHDQNTVELGDKELFGHTKIVPYPYEVNLQLVTGIGSLTPICSSSNHSLTPSLTVYGTIWDISANVNNYFGMLATHYLTYYSKGRSTMALLCPNGP